MSFGFIPFFSSSSSSQKNRPNPTFTEVFFLKNERGGESKEAKEEIIEAQLAKLARDTASPQVFKTQEEEPIVSIESFDKHKKIAQEDDKDEVVAKRVEIDLTDLESIKSLNLISSYAQVLRSCILNKTDYPKAAFRRNIEGKVYLKFVLSPDGYLKEVYVIESSNCLVLDVAALKAVEKANPFPPFPKNLKAEELFVKVPIIYKLN